jgi:hypothetical protein
LLGLLLAQLLLLLQAQAQQILIVRLFWPLLLSML